MIKDYAEKIVKLEKLLLLMRAIEKLSQKEKETPEEINSLNKMVAMYEEQTIILAQSENLNQTVKVPTSSNSSVPMPPVISEKAPEQIVNKDSFLQQIQSVQLKQVGKNTDKKTLASPENTDSASSKFLLDLKNALSTNKLKRTVNTVVSENSVTTKKSSSSKDESPTTSMMFDKILQSIQTDISALEKNEPVAVDTLKPGR